MYFCTLSCSRLLTLFLHLSSRDTKTFTPPRDIVHIILRPLATLITMRLLRRQVYRSDNKVARGLNTNAINTSTALVSVARSYHCCDSSNTRLSDTRWAIWVLKCAILWRKKGGRRGKRPWAHGYVPNLSTSPPNLCYPSMPFHLPYMFNVVSRCPQFFECASVR